MDIYRLLVGAFGRRNDLYGRDDTDCYRLFNSDGDGIGGLSIDRYGRYLLLQCFNKRAGAMAASMGDALEKALGCLPFMVEGIVMKDRKKEENCGDIATARRSVLLRGNAPPDDYRVMQNGMTVCVDLMKGQNTGVFLDMREARKALASFYIPGGRMLNLFCYTGLFSVHALRHGMGHALNVDLSAAVLKKARENYRLNGLPLDERDFIRGDALEWIGRMKKKAALFSYAVIDPPTFARHRRRNFSVRKHFRPSLTGLSPLVPEGLVFTAVNLHSVGYEEYLSYHPRGWKLEWFGNESSDFARSGEPYLKAGLWKTGF